jgi:hypothetical protein
VDLLVDEALRRGAHPDDRDSLTDMTLLMYACKAGANGVGHVNTASKVKQFIYAHFMKKVCNIVKYIR